MEKGDLSFSSRKAPGSIAAFGRLIPNTSYMVVRPAPKGDLSATEVKRYDASNGAWANFINLLGPT